METALVTGGTQLFCICFICLKHLTQIIMFYLHNSRWLSGVQCRSEQPQVKQVLHNLRAFAHKLRKNITTKSAAGQSQGHGPFYKNSFIYLSTTVHFFFSADSICYILWCDSEGRAHFAPFVILLEMLTWSGAQCRNQDYSLSSLTSTSRHFHSRGVFLEFTWSATPSVLKSIYRHWTVLLRQTDLCV